MKAALTSVFLLGASALAAQEPPRQVFRAATHVVPVEVAVFDGDHAVRGLGASDFEVLDNGVPQSVTVSERSALPVDVRLLFDTSGSISEEDLEKYRRAMVRVAEALRPEDRCEIWTFGGRITEVANRQHPPVKISLSRAGPDGTSFFDAVSLAMITRPVADRRQITIVLSDAQDNASFFDKDVLFDAARRTHAVVYTILPIAQAKDVTKYSTRLDMLSRMTGGRLVRAQWDATMGNTIVAALEEFRQGYVLSYLVSGVPSDGWHKLTVRVRGARRLAVRAREGYFGR
jgi:VWFA-related protein